tara:strand:- start:654 stop:3059 length:2406 start_codon:yes stop_codon:yes gene_type:complete
MVYTNIIDAKRSHFIIISPNYNEENNFIGTKINIKTYVPRHISSNNNCYEFTELFNETNFSNEKFKNRVIFSSLLSGTKRPMTLLTQQNLYHNIKFIQKNNNLSEPRILFTKYDITNNIINNNQYLLNPKNNIIDLTDIMFNNKSYDIYNTNDEIQTTNDDTYINLKRFSYFFNIYKPFVNSDYYKFKFMDFIDLSNVLQNKIIDYNKNNAYINVNNITLNNTFDSNILINYDVNNFTKLFKFKHIGGIKTNSDALDISIISPFLLNNNTSYENDNILLYNKLNNISTINYKLNYPQYSFNSDIIDGYSDVSINFIVLKGYNYMSKDYGKIYLSSDFTYLNSRVLDYNNNFYANNIINSSGLDSSMIYLSLGNGITGITQEDLYTKMKLDIKYNENTTVEQQSRRSTNINRILISDSISSINVANSIRYRNYLLEEGYDYDYVNILYTILDESTKKLLNFDLLDYYHNYNNDFSQNIYNHRFNSLGLLNNEISSNKFDVSYVDTNNSIIINTRHDISFSKYEYKFKLNNYTLDSFRAIDSLYNNSINNKLQYDFKFNYDTKFNVDIYYTLNYSYGLDKNDLSFTLLNDYNDNLLLNFHKIISTSNLSIPPGSDFTNVDCIYIYHDPYDDDTPEQFKYPYNNIEISNNPTIDTLNKAIELLPGATTSVTNTTFIPARNGSNLSRKKIQGLIGLNNIPGLLSIEPYDENSIIGRGFLNQYQIADDCKTETEIIENKLNSQKHISVKNNNNNNNNNNIPRTKKFANIVRNNKLNQKISTAKSCEADPNKITNYNTRFTNPMWRK